GGRLVEAEARRLGRLDRGRVVWPVAPPRVDIPIEGEAGMGRGGVGHKTGTAVGLVDRLAGRAGDRGAGGDAGRGRAAARGPVIGHAERAGPGDVAGGGQQVAVRQRVADRGVGRGGGRLVEAEARRLGRLDRGRVVGG